MRAKLLLLTLLILGAAVFLASYFFLHSMEPTRVPGVPHGVSHERPWGSHDGSAVILEDDFQVLLVSSGGAKGAFSAGVVSAWEKQSERPEFDLVSGVSIGSIVAVHAFAGPQFDEQLRWLFTQSGHISNMTPLAYAKGGLEDDAPFRKTLEKLLSEELIDTVAKRHKEGARLFVGTSYLDKGALRVWDMGEIASSDRPDRLQHFREVVLASCSVPLVFPPVYFPVTVDGVNYSEMHVDGGTMCPVYLPNLEVTGHGSIYVIVNHHVGARNIHGTVAPDPASIGITALSLLQAEQLAFTLKDIERYSKTLEAELHLLHLPSEGLSGHYTLDPTKSGGSPKKMLLLGELMLVTPGWVKHLTLSPITEH